MSTYIQTHTRSLAQKNSYIWAMYCIVIFSATVCDSSCLKQENVCVLLEQSQTLQLCLALGTHRTHVTICYLLQAKWKRRWERSVSRPSSFPLSLSPLWCNLNILALSEEVHREEQKEKSTVSATPTSDTFFSVFLLLTVHALLAASSFALTPPSVHAGLFHIIPHDAKQDHTTMSGECRWGAFGRRRLCWAAGAIARCGAREARACAIGRWGPCRTSRSAPIGCPQSRGCPTGDASETPSGRSRVFLLAPGVLERRREEKRREEVTLWIIK